MTTKQKFQAIIFDMDGLMLNSEAMGKWAWSRAVESFNLELPDAVFFRMIGLSTQASNQVLLDHFGLQFPVSEARALRVAFGNEYYEKFGVHPQPGFHELIDFISDRQIPTAVATSTDKLIAIDRLQRADVLKYFKTIITGDMVSRSKPEPDIFLYAAKTIKVTPAHCIVLEDSENGIRAAHAAGMIPIMVPDMQTPSAHIKSLTYRVCDSLKDVKDILLNEFELIPE